VSFSHSIKALRLQTVDK